jgi:PAS domain S-box-containing protein
VFLVKIRGKNMNLTTQTVLLVDDCLEDRITYRRYLSHNRHHSYNILEAETGEEALLLCRQKFPDIILLDYLLPDLNGLEFLDRLKIQFGQANFPVVMLTGQGNEQIAVQAMKDGAAEYLIKQDLIPESLRLVIENVREKQATLNARKQAESAMQVYTAELEIRVAERTAKLVQANLQLQQQIKERQQAEAAVQESERRLSTLINNLPGYVYRVANDRNYTPEFISQGVFAISEYKQEEYLLERTISYGKDIHPDDAKWVWEKIQQAIAAHKLYECEYRLITKSGTQKWVWERGQGIYTKDGELVFLEGFVTDISDRKSAEQKIREQAALLDIASDAIYVRDLEHRILFWNSGAERLYGWTVAETFGKKTSELMCHPSSFEIQAAIKTVLEVGSWQGELQKLTKSGQEAIVSSRMTLVRDEAGQAKSILTVDTDITEKKQLEAQFYRAQRLESLGTLASGIAHDINNILTPIIGFAQLLPLQLPNLNAKNRQMLEIITDNAKRGTELVEQILLFAQGKPEKRVVLQLKNLLKKIEHIVKETFPNSIKIISDRRTSELWTVSADPTQIYQVLINLCVNARDAMPDGGILTIAADNQFFDRNYVRKNLEAKIGNYVVITVSDTGCGVPEEIKERIFDPFFTTKGSGKGTGLGLSTAIGIVKNHDGFVNLKSEIGKGSQFQVCLPAIDTKTIQENSVSNIFR